MSAEQGAAGQALLANSGSLRSEDLIGSLTRLLRRLPIPGPVPEAVPPGRRLPLPFPFHACRADSQALPESWEVSIFAA